MKKHILNLKGVSIITKKEQKSVNGGFYGGGCQPQIILCETDKDCPCGPCGIDAGIFFEGICAY